MKNQSINLDKVVLGLINVELNKELLKEVPYREFLDLATIYLHLVENEEGELEQRVVTKEQQESLGISSEELYTIAEKNTFAQYPPIVHPMFDEAELIMMNLAAGIEVGSMEPQMIMVTNEVMLGGAVALLSPEPFRWIAEYLQDDMYVLPSSTHELIVVGCRGKDPAVLLDTVSTVNREQLKPEQILSYNIYKINKDVQDIQLVSSAKV